MQGGSPIFWMMSEIKSGCKLLKNCWIRATDVYIVTFDDIWLQFCKPEWKQVKQIWFTK